MNIPLSEKEKIRILNTEDLYSIMQKVLLRENKIDRDKEHFWVIGLALDYRILFVELISLGSVANTIVEPMEVFSVALQKRAVQIILCHNHPSGQITPSEEDKDITDRLIQVGIIVNTPVLDHQIITPKRFLSFEATDLMKELRKSSKYVPSFEMAKRIRREAAQILQQTKEDFDNRMKEIEKELKQEKRLRNKAEQQLLKTAQHLKEEGMPIKQIAQLTGLTQKEIKAL